jgi:hypothetical protein
MSILAHPPTKTTPIYSGARVVGKVTGGVFVKTVAGSAHFLRKPPAIAFDVSSLDDAERAGAVQVQVTDRETGRIYRAPLALVRSAGFAVNRGYGAQWALPLCYWSVDGKPPQMTPATRVCLNVYN